MDEKRKILLIMEAQSGDKEAFNKLLISIQKDLYWYIYNVVADKNCVDDILQEVFVIIYRKLPLLREPEYFRTWVFKIATREIFHTIKKKKSLKLDFPGQEELDAIPENEEIFKLSARVIERLNLWINDLTPPCKAVITLHYKNGITIREIADILNISAGTVKSRLSYGLIKIRNKALTDSELKEELGL